MTSALPFEDLISQEEMDRFGMKSPTQRRRLFPADITLRAFLSQVVGRSGSCQKVVTEVYLDALTYLKKCPSLNTASYSKARGRLSLDAISDLTRQIHRELTEMPEQGWCWKNRKVTFIDGSTVAMSDTPENLAIYPKRRNQKEYNGYPIARVMLACSLETGSVADFNIAAFRGKSTGEIPLGAKILNSIECGNVVVTDAMFVSYSFIGLCQRQGLDFLAHKKTNRKFTVIAEKRISAGDRLIQIKKPQIPHTGWIEEELYAKLPETITLRETQVTVEKIGFRAKSVTILSTLIDADTYAKSDLAELLLLRWNIELDIRVIKRELGLHFISSKSPEMVHKEIWVKLLAFNIIRRLIVTAAKLAKLIPRRISFKRTLDYYLASFRLQSFSIADLPSAVIEAISKFYLPKQEGRFEPRARKTSYGHNDYPVLTLTRRRWRLVVIMSFLEDLEFSPTFCQAFEDVKKQIPRVKGKPRY